MNASLNYTVRIIKCEEELTNAFRLRYNIYKKTFPRFIEKLTEALEFDGYDSRSIHLGMFCEEAGGEKLIGYCRMILPSKYKNRFSKLLFAKHPKLTSSNLHKNHCEKLGFISYLPSRDHKKFIANYCNQLEKKNEVYCETSRFIIDEDHRSLSVSTFFVSCMIGVCNSLQIKFDFFTCDPHHESFYRKFGLEAVSGFGDYYTACFGARKVIFGTRFNISEPFKSSIKLLSKQFSKEGSMSLNKYFKAAA